ncbi:MAG: response regulator [Phycisphaeraceae bacterium]
MSSSKPLIVIVDDETHILHVVSLKLRNAGFEVITAQNGEEGFDAIAQHRPDLVITDYQMPVMSGLEMCTRLKAEPVTANIRAIMLTARGFSISAEALEQTNIQAVLSKPFSPREVLTKVQEMVLGTVDKTEAI